jgi:hypothetical protein
MRHLPIPEQGRYLRLVLNGFYNYHAIPTNSGALKSLLLPLAFPMAALPAAAKPAAQGDMAEDDAARGALAAQPEVAALYPDWRFDVMTRGGAWGATSMPGPAREDEQSPSYRDAACSIGYKNTFYIDALQALLAALADRDQLGLDLATALDR